MNKGKALQSLAPGAEWVICGDEIAWLSDDIAKPTDAEIQAELQRLIEEAPRRNASLSRADFKIGLLEMGELDNVQALMDDPATDPRIKIMYEDSGRFERMHPDLLQLAEVMGYTEEQLDELFGINI